MRSRWLNRFLWFALAFGSFIWGMFIFASLTVNEEKALEYFLTAFGLGGLCWLLYATVYFGLSLKGARRE